jgi:hypothetical protein
MKFLSLLWITIARAVDASVWATALWCLVYSFTNVSWFQYFWIFLAIQFLWSLPFVRFINALTKKDCFSYLRRESALIGLSILYAPIFAILPTVAVIVLLSILESWTGLETHWLHTWLFVSCLVYVLSRNRDKRRMAWQAKSKQLRRQPNLSKQTIDQKAGTAKEAAKEPRFQRWVQEPVSKIARSKAPNREGSVQVIDV